MKIRTGFVSNSSSSSFIVNSNEPSDFVKEHYLKIEDDRIKQKIINTFDGEIDTSKDIWLSPFYWDGCIKSDLDGYTRAEGEEFDEAHGNVTYDDTIWEVLDEDKGIAIRRTENERLEYIMSRYPTADEYNKWIEGAKKYLDNELNQEEIKAFVKLDDKINRLFQYIIDKYDEGAVSYNDIDYLTGSRLFLYILAPHLTDLIVKIRKEITKDVLADAYDY